MYKNPVALFQQFSNLDILPLISLSYIICFNKLTLMLKIISQCDIKHILMLQIKTITLVLKVSTYMYIITSFTALPIRLTA